jgi:uncharacterized protein YjbJ (UPF0337 family)
MDENRVEGTARNVKGKFQEDIGSLAGNARMRAEGLANQAGGAAQDLCGARFIRASGRRYARHRGDRGSMAPPHHRNTALHQCTRRAWDRMGDRPIAPAVIV